MDKPKPIKRHAAIVSFSREHHFGLLLVWKIRQGIKLERGAMRLSNYVQYFFQEDLLRHFKDEEKFLFPLLPATDAFRLRAEKEHAEIYKLVAGIGKNKTSLALLNELAEVLDKHIRFEERELFNHIQETVPAESLKMAEERMLPETNTVDENWDDHFWLK